MKKVDVIFAHNNDSDVENMITAFIHCKQCIKELEDIAPISPRDYARIEFGYTKKGFQVRCVRHECNIDLCEYRVEGP